MNKKFINLAVVSALSLFLVTSCGEEEAVTSPDIQQYANEQANQQTSTPNQQQAAKPAVNTQTNSKPATNTAKPATNTSGTATETKTPATPATDTSGLTIAQKILLKTKQTYDGLKNYSATIVMYSKRNDKVAPKANPAINMEFKYIYQPPRLAVFNVVKHNISMVVGAKMIWDGGDSAKVKASGVLGLFPMDLKLSDEKMTTNRNWRFDQLDHVGMLGRANDPKAKVELAGKTQVNGKDAYMLKVTNNGLDDGITEEHIAIDAKTFMVVADEMYSGTDLIFQLKMTIEGTNITIPPGTMDL